MDFSNNIVQLHNDRSISRETLSKAISTLSVILGRYKLNEINHSVEVTAKIADSLDLSLDYLVGASSFVLNDKK
jgi:hypothetical protein